MEAPTHEGLTVAKLYAEAGLCSIRKYGYSVWGTSGIRLPGRSKIRFPGGDTFWCPSKTVKVECTIGDGPNTTVRTVIKSASGSARFNSSLCAVASLAG